MPLTYKLTVEEICMKLKPVFGKRIDEIYLKYAMAETREEREEIEHILNVLYSKHLSELLNRKVLLEPPEKEDMQGEYPLAIVSYANKKLYPFSLREQDWIRHVCISGMSGSGKTTLAFHIVGNFIKKEKPFLIFDWKKSFRPLMLVDNEIMLFTVGNENISNLFRININQPPEGVSPKEWINVLCDLITESFFASYGVHKVLLETLDEAFKDLGVYNGSKNYPTWNEIKWRLENKLEKTRGRNATWLESALRVAHVLTFGNFGKVLNYKGKDCLTVEDLLNKKVIFELNSLGAIEKKFFCEFILTYIYKLKKANQTKLNEKFDHAILVDEAHNIFLKDKTHFVKESVTDMIYREMREYGTCLICLDQHISKISDTVAGNSACHVAFQQQLPQDVEAISGLMQLRERKQYFSMLPVGSAIVKLAERYNLPFLIEVSEVELRGHEVSDEEIAQRMKFIFEGRKIELGEDKEFAEALMIPEAEEEKARAPNHTLFSGELEEFRELDTDISKDHSLKDLDKLQEIQREMTIDNQRAVTETAEKNVESTMENAVETKVVKAEVAELEEPAVKIIEQAEVKPVTKIIEEKIEIPLTRVQQILYEYAKKKLDKGWSLNQIEKVLDEHRIEGGYTTTDVIEVINYALRDKFVTTQKEEKRKIYKGENDSLSKYTEGNLENLSEELSDEQKRFLAFLQENLEHQYSTIELYKKVGLSARKGNKIKDELMKKGLIKIQEEKNSKGWKKFIRLNL